METTDIRTMVRERYGRIAEGATDPSSGCCGTGCGCSSSSSDVLTEIGYSPADAAVIPEGANLGLGCGNPLADADAKPGETVLDLGSGAGIDCFLAAREVGPGGQVIGVDMTPAMLERARANAVKSGVMNVEFRLGEIEHLPVADTAVDLVISNCVINLSPDKPAVFREALRVLKPGGRLVVSDLVLTRPLSEQARNNVELYVGCVAGAMLKDEYLGAMRTAGFDSVEVVRENAYTVGAPSESDREVHDAFASVVSVKVRAVKR